jgi:NAD-dependent deacetylase
VRAKRDGRSIVVLTGAGISAESGLPTFRGNDGLWMGRRLEEVATPEAFARQPQVVQRFYDLRRRQLLAPEIAPNAAHRALAELERRWSGPVQIITQNIDDLHERAGSTAARAAMRPARGAAIWPARIAVRAAAGPGSCGPTSYGSARCRSS